MIFTVDKHGQLNITSNGGIKVVLGEPNTIVLTQDETEKLRQLLRIDPERNDDGHERPSQWSRTFFGLRLGKMPKGARPKD